MKRLKMRGQKQLFSSARDRGRDDWQTPDRILAAVTRLAVIGLDPCTTRGNPVNARDFFCSRGLNLPWRGRGLVFVNPPFSKVDRWIDKSLSEYFSATPRDKLEIVLLLAARTDTAWFQRLLKHARAIVFIRGRIRFRGARWSAPFPSVLVYLGYRPSSFARAVRRLGLVAIERTV